MARERHLIEGWSSAWVCRNPKIQQHRQGNCRSPLLYGSASPGDSLVDCRGHPGREDEIMAEVASPASQATGEQGRKVFMRKRL